MLLSRYSIQHSSTLIKLIFLVFVISLVSSCKPNEAIGNSINETDSQEIILIPEGKFIAGSDYSNDGPSYKSLNSIKASLDSFWIYKTEVTTSQYAKFLIDIGYIEGDREIQYIHFDFYQKVLYDNGHWMVGENFVDFPVENISYKGAEAYCKWAGGRLPSNLEWEKAARGSKGNIYPWGNESIDICDYANIYGCIGSLVAVGSSPNGGSPYGVLDMVGNVEEWTDGWFFVGKQKTRTYRGGSYGSPIQPIYLYTGDFGGGLGPGPIGFRCVIDYADSIPSNEP